MQLPQDLKDWQAPWPRSAIEVIEVAGAIIGALVIAGLIVAVLSLS